MNLKYKRLGVLLACGMFLGALAENMVAAQEAKPARTEFAGEDACRNCHAEEFRTYGETAHHRTSEPPSKETILGSFADGQNVMKTSNPFLSFRMEAKADGFYQTAVWEIASAATTRTEKVDVVIGSGRRGQTYLYWKKGQLFQLPVSYWTDLHAWINSPNYQDGEANFEKRVLPNCLACHMSYAAAIGSPVYSNEFRKDSLVLGISCERCHGPGKKHAEAMAAKGPDAIVARIGRLSRAKQVEVCAQCHGGLRAPIEDPFSYVPGEELEKYFRSPGGTVLKTADVHGNQVGLLQMSKCYQSSPNMGCTTCHDVHRTQREAPAFAERCLTCHGVESCGEFSKMGRRLEGKCVDCHMPVETSNVIISSLNGKPTKAMVRSHWIKVYSEFRDKNSAPRN